MYPIDISALQNENRELKLHQQESDGIMASLSSGIVSMKKKLESLNMHSMKKKTFFTILLRKIDENLYV